MSDFIILTDSSADLSGEMAQAADVQVLPLTFTIGGADYHNYPDNREMDPHLFYQRLRAGEVATTAAVNMNQYVEAIEPLLQAGKDVLTLAFSFAKKRDPYEAFLEGAKGGAKIVFQTMPYVVAMVFAVKMCIRDRDQRG